MIFSRTPTPPLKSPLLAQPQVPAWEPPLPPAQIYSVPRRFDLATLLTVSLAYSLLFAILKAFDASWVTFLFLGGLTVAVGAAQAWAEHSAQVRKASMIAGGVYCVVVGAILLAFAPMPAGERVLIAFCLATSPGIGYLAGAIDGGLFLVADMVRRHLPDGREEPSGREKFTPSPDLEGPLSEDRAPP